MQSLCSHCGEIKEGPFPDEVHICVCIGMCVLTEGKGEE